MLLVGLTGGIGSGKSTVARMLAERGAVVIDADELARDAVGRGTPGFEQVVAVFGDEVLTESGDIDREALARRVFTDQTERRRLEAIIHPEVARLFAERVEPFRATDRIVVYVVPLLVENRLERAFDIVVTVEAAEDVRVERLAAGRGMSEEAVRDRIAAQSSDEERRRVATFVLRNDGSLHDLDRELDRLLVSLADARSRSPRAT